MSLLSPSSRPDTGVIRDGALRGADRRADQQPGDLEQIRVTVIGLPDAEEPW
jgi:hypothetical protein